MSLRNRRGEEWEKPEDPAKHLEATLRAHRLTSFGSRGWKCVCGKIHTASKRRDAEIQHGMHLSAVKESVEDRAQGISHYGDEDE